MASIPDTIAANNARILKLLITVPGTFNPRDVNIGLVQAAKLGHVECAQCLLGAGADKDFTGPSSYTPLQTAIQNKHLTVVNELISYGCDVNFKGRTSYTPLHLAAKHGQENIANVLISRGAVANSRDAQGNTPLILATKYGQYLVMKSLIEAGCDVDAADTDGCTALHYACHRARGFQVLLDAGANPNVRDNDNITPILMAATEGFDGVVRALVEAKCDVNVPNNSVKKTALHILAFKGHTNCINDLVYGGADIDICDKFNRTPLWYAIKNKKVDVVRVLLKSYSHADTFKCSAGESPDDCPARLAFSLKLFDVVKFFVLTGYDHDHVRDCLTDKDLTEWLQNNEEYAHWLEFASGAQTLKQICRKWIRHYLGRQFFHHLHFLPIPDVMREYLFLEELHDH